MNTPEFLLQFLTGGFLWMMGQILRFLIGYRKLNDEAAKQGKKFPPYSRQAVLSSALLLV